VLNADPVNAGGQLGHAETAAFVSLDATHLAGVLSRHAHVDVGQAIRRRVNDDTSNGRSMLLSPEAESRHVKEQKDNEGATR